MLDFGVILGFSEAISGLLWGHFGVIVGAILRLFLDYFRVILGLF